MNNEPSIEMLQNAIEQLRKDLHETQNDSNKMRNRIFRLEYPNRGDATDMGPRNAPSTPNFNVMNPSKAAPPVGVTPETDYAAVARNLRAMAEDYFFSSSPNNIVCDKAATAIETLAAENARLRACRYQVRCANVDCPGQIIVSTK